ncbi:MAG: transporter substrate-binding domain-containing protein [Methanomicrobiales archaeon]|nr:transporter substrate-binding domain-containing protein [Methanomicrobiales archaeon]
MQPTLMIKNRKRTFLHQAILAAMALVIIAALCSPVSATRDVKVALTELKPSLYTNDMGEPDGFFVDVVETIAEEEDWNVIWVSGSISRSWERLDAGEIDLMPAVSRTPDRDTLYDFGNESALSVWSQVYARPGSGINTILDLQGKQVAMVRGASSGSGLKDYAKRFDVNTTFLEKDTPAEIFSAVASGDADALVVYNTAGDADAKTYGLTATPVMFNPVQMSFAVQKGKNRDLLAALDKGIAEGKRSPTSPYNQAMQKWYGIKAGSTIPSWLFGGLIVFACVAVLFVAMSYLLRREVAKKTAELSRQHEELLAAYQQLRSTEEELRRNYTDLAMSEKALRQARRKLQELSTLTTQDIRSGFFSLTGYITLAKGAGSPDAAKELLIKSDEILQKIQNSLLAAKKYQDLGMRQPAWQDVNIVFLSAISHLDFIHVARSVKLDNMEIFADPLLEDVFTTIMRNVIVHGGNADAVRLFYRKNADNSVTIIAENRGPGIPRDQKERIFSRDYPRKEGLGLYLAREILSITDITIAETGDPDVGARFEITVPEGEYRFADTVTRT